MNTFTVEQRKDHIAAIFPKMSSSNVQRQAEYEVKHAQTFLQLTPQQIVTWTTQKNVLGLSTQRP